MITLQNWLADRKRKYADGLALFQALAPEEMRKKYIAFFSEVKEVPQFDSHFTVLVNKLTTVARLSSGPTPDNNLRTGFDTLENSGRGNKGDRENSGSAKRR